ncbi:Rnase Y domain-containing protein, partial [Patescibacteria group bacterium]|nr:Rnase Y domain-containing protein [Patescibacteria group bacterium]
MWKTILEKIFHTEEAKETALAKANQESKSIVLRANEEAMRIKQEAEHESRKILRDALEAEKRLAKKEQQLDDRSAQLNREQVTVERERTASHTLKRDWEEKREAILQKLEKIAQMTKDQAKELLLQGWEEKLKREIAGQIKAADEQVKQAVDEKAKQLLIDAMRYGATDTVAEYTLSVVNLPN